VKTAGAVQEDDPLRFLRAIARIFVPVFVAVLTFVLIETWRLGWLHDAEGSSRVIPIQEIREEALALGYRAGMMNAWVHNIRVGQVVGFHEHPTRAELVVILRGRARVRGLRMAPDGGEPLLREEILGPGQMVLSPATSVHEYTNVGNEPLWSLVFMSPPVQGNLYLEGAPSSALDFLVIPWGSDGEVRGAFIPEWLRGREMPWQGGIGYYPGIPGRLLRDPREIHGHHTGVEAWVVLLRGRGWLEVGETKQQVRAPTWISAPDGRWSLQSDQVELVALEFLLPRFDARLFVRSTIERLGLARLEQWIPALKRLAGNEPWGT
jgi:mannose-6-phosphate isomerase-like protein (cupin superfamily)